MNPQQDHFKHKTNNSLPGSSKNTMGILQDLDPSYSIEERKADSSSAFPSLLKSTAVSTQRAAPEALHTISLLVQNQPGVLVRIALVFSRRNYNIESLVVSSELKKDLSRITITARGSQEVLEQVVKQLRKLVSVVRAEEHMESTAIIEREMALVKIVISQRRREILPILEHFKAHTLDLGNNSMIAQITGSTEKVDAFLNMLRDYNVIESIRTGKVLISRGSLLT